VLSLALVVAPAVAAGTYVDAGRTVPVRPGRGADPSVDYASLTRYGPWDDRNYALTAADLTVLADNEHELADPIPAFFRVAMRKALPWLPRTGPVQYPRSALQVFRQRFGGYLIEGSYYRKLDFGKDGSYAVILEGGVPSAEPDGSNGFVSGEVRVTSPNAAAESAIAVSPADSSKVVAGSNGPGGGQKMHFSGDGGQSWTETSLPLGGTCCDPAVDWSSDGTYAYTTALGGCFFSCALWFYRSDDGGATWNSLADVDGDPRREIVTSGADKEYLHVDRSSRSPYKDHIYVTWHNGNVQQFARSTDLGHTWARQSFSSAPTGIGGDITTDASGNIYYFWPSPGARTIQLLKSADGGLTFGSPSVVATTQGAFDFPVPSMESRRVFIYNSAGADLSGGSYDGSVYVAWTDNSNPDSGIPENNHARIQVAYSRDAGQSWTVTTPHETADVLSVDRWHQWLAVGPDGTVHVVFYDTRRDPARTGVDLFYSFSTDGAQTWSPPQRVTTVLSPNIQDGFEYGDYNGLDIVMNDLIAIFTDNRDETGGGLESVDVYAAGIAPGGGAFCGNSTIEAGEACDGVDLGGQTCADFACAAGALACLGDCSALDLSGCSDCAGGPGYVPDGDGAPGTPLAVARAGADITLTWAAACGAASDYAVYEGLLGDPGSLAPVQCSTGGATSVTITPSAGDRFYLVTALEGGFEGSYGVRGDGSERDPATAACLPRQLGTCP